MFSPGARLTLLSDGVAEARNATGQLFGFDRLRQISTEPAESIAQEAQSFGQQDDITVLTLTLLAASLETASEAQPAPIPAPA
jgi:serine phosphatase RsbU (regulator of sigma subunit)